MEEVELEEGVCVGEEARRRVESLCDSVEGDGLWEGESIGELEDDGEDDADDTCYNEYTSSKFSFEGVLSIWVEFHGDAEEIDFWDPFILSNFMDKFAQSVHGTGFSGPLYYGGFFWNDDLVCVGADFLSVFR